MGKFLGISGKTVERAWAVLKQGDDQIKEALRNGKLSINGAYLKVRPPQDSAQSETPPAPEDNPEDCFGEFRDSPRCEKCVNRKRCVEKTNASLKPCFELYPGSAPDECACCPVAEECKARAQQNHSGEIREGAVSKKRQTSVANTSKGLVELGMTLLERIEEAACCKDWARIDDFFREAKDTRESLGRSNDWIFHLVSEFAPGNIDYVVFGQGPVTNCAG